MKMRKKNSRRIRRRRGMRERRRKRKRRNPHHTTRLPRLPRKMGAVAGDVHRNLVALAVPADLGVVVVEGAAAAAETGLGEVRTETERGKPPQSSSRNSLPPRPSFPSGGGQRETGFPLLRPTPRPHGSTSAESRPRMWTSRSWKPSSTSLRST